MGERKRQHIIPKLLLNQFAAESRGEQAFVWRWTADGSSTLTNTRNVTVEKNFYGKEDEG